MKVARLIGPQQFAFEEVEMPSVQDGEVLVRMEYFSVCGSDLRVYDRTLRDDEYPLGHGAPCHENVGVVETSRNPAVTPGQRVIVLPPAGLVEYAAVPAQNLVPVPDNGADPAMWVLCQSVGTVLYGVTQIGTILGKRIAIFGQGPIGLSFTDFIVRAGARQVIVVDPHDYRLDIARNRGATHTINPTRDDSIEAIQEITEGEMTDVAIEAAGRPETYQGVFGALRKQGTAVIFGIPHDDDASEFDWMAIARKVPRMIVTNSNGSGNMAAAVATTVDLVSQGRLSIDYLLTHLMDWEDVGRAYETYSGKLDNSLKVVMKA
jgi:threonine dehydrogenase-like Zn-dependent dehydrogenase